MMDVNASMLRKGDVVHLEGAEYVVRRTSHDDDGRVIIDTDSKTLRIPAGFTVPTYRAPYTIRDQHHFGDRVRVVGERRAAMWKDATWKCWVGLEIEEDGAEKIGGLGPDTLNAATLRDLTSVIDMELKNADQG